MLTDSSLQGMPEIPRFETLYRPPSPAGKREPQWCSAIRSVPANPRNWGQTGRNGAGRGHSGSGGFLLLFLKPFGARDNVATPSGSVCIPQHVVAGESTRAKSGAERVSGRTDDPQRAATVQGLSNVFTKPPKRTVRTRGQRRRPPTYIDGSPHPEWPVILPLLWMWFPQCPNNWGRE